MSLPRSHRHPSLLQLLLLAAALLATPRVHAADWSHPPYQLGQGLYFPAQQLRLGGYANLHYYNVKGNPTALSVHDVSLFVTKDFGPRWKAFAEIELANGITLTRDRTSTRNAEFDVERLYVDYHARQGVSLRVGKFLTPVGQWNLVHADPLVWTVSRPLATSAAFARHATGAMLYGTVPVNGNDLDYWLFVDDSEDLAPAPDRDLAFSAYGADPSQRNNFRRAAGARLLYHMLDGRLAVGTSYLRYSLQDPQHSYELTGMDFSWSMRHLTLSGEGIYRTSDYPGLANEYGGYLQAVVPLHDRLYAVGRIERYRSSLLNRITIIRTLALNYRPLPGITFKLEHRAGHHNASLEPSGWLASFAVLF